MLILLDILLKIKSETRLILICSPFQCIQWQQRFLCCAIGWQWLQETSCQLTFNGMQFLLFFLFAYRFTFTVVSNSLSNQRKFVSIHLIFQIRVKSTSFVIENERFFSIQLKIENFIELLQHMPIQERMICNLFVDQTHCFELPSNRQQRNRKDLKANKNQSWKNIRKNPARCCIKPKSSKNATVDVTNISIFCRTHNCAGDANRWSFFRRVDFSAEHRRQMDFNEDIHLEEKTIVATATMMKTMPYPCHSYFFLLCSFLEFCEKLQTINRQLALFGNFIQNDWWHHFDHFYSGMPTKMAYIRNNLWTFSFIRSTFFALALSF